MSSDSHKKIIYSYRDGDAKRGKLLFTEDQSLEKKYPNTFGISKSASKLNTSNPIIKQYKDSKVIIVGNSPTVLNNELGDYIDSHDIVIRINKCTTKGFEKNIGSKIDIWATTHPEYHKNPNNHDELFTPDNDENIRQIWKRTPKVKLNNLPERYHKIDCFTMFKNSKFRNNKKFVDYGKRLGKYELCTGLLTILSSTLFFKTPTITGFSFYTESKGEISSYYKHKEQDELKKHIEDKYWEDVAETGFASSENALIKNTIIKELQEEKLINII